MSILHNLPLDVIRFHIFSRLDWSSRVTANVLLKPADRLSFPFKKDAGISLMMRKEHDVIKKKLSYVANYNTQEENYHAIVNLMKAMKDVSYLIQYSSNFRKAFIDRSTRFADLESGEYATVLITDDEKKVLVILAQENLQRLETLPFLREVISSCKDTWTAVGAGPPHIVEQTVYKYFNDYEEYDFSDEAWEARWYRGDD